MLGKQLRLLQLHSDFIEYEPIAKEIEEAEENVSKSKYRLEDLVVCLIAVEQGDDAAIASAAISDIKSYLDRVKSRRILIYPYSHLSSNLAPPDMAFKILTEVESIAKNTLDEVYRAPFGWTKALNIKVKGHPLSENFKVFGRHGNLVRSNYNHMKGGDSTIVQEEQISSALKAEEKLESSWFILNPGGKLVPLGEYNFTLGERNLKTLASYETSKKRLADEVPPHVKLMRKMGIADYEPASDAGNMRFYPKGRLMKSLIEQYVTKCVMNYGGIEVETPIMYDSKHPSMESYFNRFPARQYNILSDGNRQFFLRFAACFGQFLMAKDFQISYKHLPLRLYELSRYSFRREKRGELVGLRRLRAFSMPDCHALCKDMMQAKDEFLKRIDLSLDVINGLGITAREDLEMALRFTQEFYNDNKDYINELVTRFGKPVVVEIWKDRFFYFILKWEFNYIDYLGKASALSTDQIDIENGKRYQIEFIDENGNRKNPIILHNSPSGAIERVIFALLEKASKLSYAGSKPTLPLWLIHTQVRIIAVCKQHKAFCEQIQTMLTNMSIRADIDDREESVSKKIRESEMEWIPYTLVVGDKELQEQKFILRDRVQGEQRVITLDGLAKEIKTLTLDKPYVPLNLPAHLSERPQIMV